MRDFFGQFLCILCPLCSPFHIPIPYPSTGKKALGYVAAKSNNVCWQFPGADCPEPLCSTPANKTQVICDKGQCAVGPLQCAQTVALSELCQSKTFETCKFM